MALLTKTNETKIRSHAQKAIKTSKKLKGRKLSPEHCLLISEKEKKNIIKLTTVVG